MEGNMQGYRQGLVAKYGEQRVLLLEAKKKQTRKYADFEYEQLIKYYKALGDKLRKEKGLWAMYYAINQCKILNTHSYAKN